MYARDIEHVLMHLNKMREEVTIAKERHGPRTQQRKDAEHFLAVLTEVHEHTTKFYHEAGELSIA